MQRNITTLTLTFGLLLTLAGRSVNAEDLVAHRETSRSLQQTFAIKYSDLYPQKAEEIARYIENYRQEAVQKANSAKNRGDRYEAQRIADEARSHLSSVVSQVNQVSPPTNITIYGSAVRSDMNSAKELLRAGKTQPGKPLHIYLLNGRLITSYSVPSTYDMPNGTKSGTPIDSIAAGRNGAANPRTRPGQVQGQGPNYGGLNGMAGRTLPSGTTAGGTLGGGQGGAGGSGLFGLQNP